MKFGIRDHSRRPGRAWTRRLSALTLSAALGLGAAGCATSSARGDVSGPAPQALAQQCPEVAVAVSNDPRSYLIAPGDELAIGFYLSPEFDQNAAVQPDGKVVLRLVGELPAAGMTPDAFAQRLDQAYSRELRAPQAWVRITGSPERRVYVQGQVAHPGAVALQPGMTAIQAVAEAGGLTEEAGADRAILIRRDACGLPHGSSFDLATALKNKDSNEDVALLPADVVVVPRSRIADVNLFVKQFMKNMIPVDPYLPLIP